MCLREVDVFDNRLVSEITHLYGCRFVGKSREFIVPIGIRCCTIGEFWERDSYADKFLSALLVSDGA